MPHGSPLYHRIALRDKDGNWSGLWFDLKHSSVFQEVMFHDGHNNISRATGSEWDHQTVFKTRLGNWVLKSWSQRSGSEPVWEIMPVEDAFIWFLINGRDIDDSMACLLNRSEF